VFFDSRHDEADPTEPPALAFGSRSSVFKERPGTRLTAEVPGSLRARRTRGSDTPVPAVGPTPQQRNGDPSRGIKVRQRNPFTTGGLVRGRRAARARGTARDGRPPW
jgi:hypothetical protein